MSILVVGTLAFDSVKTPFGEREDALGGSGSYLATAASFFGPVMLAGVIGKDFPAAHLNFLRSRQIDLRGVQCLPGKTFRWKGHYEHDLNVAHTLETQLNVLESFKPDLPEDYRNAKTILLGNFDPELQLSVLEQVHSPSLVACDTMNFWIERHGAKLRKTLRRVNLLSVNEGEARMLAGESNLIKAAAAIQKMGPQTVVIKRGEYGALLFCADGLFAVPGYPLEQVCDPTGAGDTFAGGMLGYMAKRQRYDVHTLRQAVVVGSLLASFVVEDFSLDRMRTLQHEEVRGRLAAFTRLTHFDASSIELS
jgi:sugar/nucleoside kinase (ribokinase family)